MPPPETPANTEIKFRRSRRSVHLADRVARVSITLGGLGVIAAVMGIMVFLAWTVAPLFQGGQQEEIESAAAPVGLDGDVLFTRVDEHQGLLVIGFGDGRYRSFFLPTGEQVGDEGMLVADGFTVTTTSASPGERGIAFGSDDGRVQLGRLGFTTGFVFADDLPADSPVLGLARGDQAPWEDGAIERIDDTQFRTTRFAPEMQEPMALREGVGAVTRLNYRAATRNTFLVSKREDDSVQVNRVRITRPLGGGEPRTRLTPSTVDWAPPEGLSPTPDWLKITADGGHLYAIWKSGVVQRYASEGRSGAPTALAETITDATGGAAITKADMLLGGLTLMLGDETGWVRGGFAARDDTTRDGFRFVVPHVHKPPRADVPVRTLGVSTRDRSFIIGYDDGTVVIRHMTSHKQIAKSGTGFDAPLASALITPKYDSFLALASDGAFKRWRIDPKHPEASFDGQFGRVWYEGEPGPSYTYQSSAAEDEAEPKLSLMPLIFGTLKATFYAMIFAAPIGVLGAIFTSEILHPGVRSAVKPTIEMMASLPSVVLGFVAAFVIAPYAKEFLPAVLMAFIVAPVGVVICAMLWQMLPIHIRSRLTSGQHLAMIGLTLCASLFVSLGIGSVMERALFTPTDDEALVLAGLFEPVDDGDAPEWTRERETLSLAERRELRDNGMFFRNGAVVRPEGTMDDAATLAVVEERGFTEADIRLWLDGMIGGAAPGWLLLLTPASLIVLSIASGRAIDPLLARTSLPRTGPQAALFEAIKFVVLVVVSLGVAWAGSVLLDALGFDPRESVFGVFNERNSLVVGIAMGFAVIPIIYTISEDALTSVPDSLRSASLGAGATRWQTAIRVVLPVAMSGIFSATMIGLGRAVGETMIVLMATGNTPIMSANIFEGFRTLAANIAVELPEAPKGSTHYRVLFLCGLALFVMTFVINTLAEIVRQRFRKRNAGL